MRPIALIKEYDKRDDFDGDVPRQISDEIYMFQLIRLATHLLR